MSYCRFGDKSDVYVLMTFSGLECCGCRLMRNSSYDAPNHIDMISHLYQHRQVGHTVPDYVFGRLRQELRAFGDMFKAAIMNDDEYTGGVWKYEELEVALRSFERSRESTLPFGSDWLELLDTAISKIKFMMTQVDPDEVKL